MESDHRATVGHSTPDLLGAPAHIGAKTEPITKVRREVTARLKVPRQVAPIRNALEPRLVAVRRIPLIKVVAEASKLLGRVRRRVQLDELSEVMLCAGWQAHLVTEPLGHSEQGGVLEQLVPEP
jgi:hypothetical protein